MALGTRSIFYYYSDEVSFENQYFNWDEGGSELTALIPPSGYSPEQLASEVQSQMNAIGQDTYVVSFNRSTRGFSISSNGSTLNLLVTTGSNAGVSVWSLLGFTSDKTGSTSYNSDGVGPKQLRSQFFLQDYIPSSNELVKVDVSVTESSSGTIQVANFGDRRFTSFNIRFITEKSSYFGDQIEANASAVTDTNDFLSALSKKIPFEFMPDRSNTGNFEVLLYESGPGSSTGTGYRLRELFGSGLPDMYETGVLRNRVINL